MPEVIERSKVLPVSQFSAPGFVKDLLTEVLRKVARELLAQAIEQEGPVYFAAASRGRLHRETIDCPHRCRSTQTIPRRTSNATRQRAMSPRPMFVARSARCEHELCYQVANSWLKTTEPVGRS